MADDGEQREGDCGGHKLSDARLRGIDACV